ncbi:MAG TPA: transcription-repair coupling factor [Thermoclostridium sp.]|nr:transcription-repair coupling factor [Thermoclostridium sp.]
MKQMYLPNSILASSSRLKALTGKIRPGAELVASGVSESQKRHLAWWTARESGMKGIYAAWNEMQARQAFMDLSWLTGDRAVYLPGREIMLYDVEARSFEQTYDRITTLVRILKGDYDFVVTSAEALMHRLMPPRELARCRLELRTGGQAGIEDLEEKLLEMGYERVDKVEGKAQYAVRGGIMDVFPINADMPCRVEFFDIEIDSIRVFSPETQRSVQAIEQMEIYPAREIIYTRGQIPAITRRIREALDKALGKVARDIRPLLEKNIGRYMEKLQDSHYFTGIDKFIPFILKDSADLFEYTGEGHLLFFEEPARTRERMENLQEELRGLCDVLTEKGMILGETYGLLFEAETVLRSALRHPVMTLSSLEDSETLTPNPTTVININGSSISPYIGKLDLLFDDLRKWADQGYKVFILVSREDRIGRLLDELREKGITAADAGHFTAWPRGYAVLVGFGCLHSGFVYRDEKLVVVTESDISARSMKKARRRTIGRGRRIETYTDLKPGDYVVHQVHGIGIYQGIEQLTVEGLRRDYLKISYRDGGTLFIPTTNMDLIQKYVGSEGREPRLNKLGGTEWARTKKRVRESLKELAISLIRLQAERKSMKGYAFSSDTVWQRQFEEAFEYEETPDQLKCIEEIKRDMESDVIMDRLLCGDVGYGKTEVALRAAFKAIMDGKQVAFLVPTTVLCSQHYENFKKRFSGFPVTVEMLSRFRTDAEQRAILRDLKAGRIDIIVGTHMLFSEEVKFRDLGLLIVDEEHRFGVAHKETIKNRYPHVDTLTLSATPIPRTLNMSLAGIRDISTIEDPPEHRYPVQTYVVEYREDIVRDAIHRELARSGQVFYLYNRVRGIQSKAAQIQKLVPEAQVGFAHGQMSERELEQVIQSFLDREFNVLVCTTIIESGIDMPNVNTIIVEDSDRLGLAQLYQLRGRVGRSNRLAYAYLTYKRDKVLGETAEKRLKAIREFTEFGSGFKIAMRDLQIRGAGNLLGPEQHGHMESVGYDMYLRLLDEAIAEIKGEPMRRASIETSVEFRVPAHIDARYIPDEDQRIDMYKSIASVEDEEEAMDVMDELIDRYGDVPEETRNLIDIALIKNMALTLGFISIKEKDDVVILSYSDQAAIDPRIIMEITRKWRGHLLFSAGKQPYLSYRVKDLEKRDLLRNIKILLHDLAKLKSID